MAPILTNTIGVGRIQFLLILEDEVANPKHPQLTAIPTISSNTLCRLDGVERLAIGQLRFGVEVIRAAHTQSSSQPISPDDELRRTGSMSIARHMCKRNMEAFLCAFAIPNCKATAFVFLGGHMILVNL